MAIRSQFGHAENHPVLHKGAKAGDRLADDQVLHLERAQIAIG